MTDMPTLSRPVVALVMALTGAVLVGGFAPFSWWGLTLLCPAILYAFIQGRSGRDAFSFGYVFGLFYFGFGVSWTYNSIHEFGHAPVLLSAVLVALLVLALALFPALTAALYSWLRRDRAVDPWGALAFATLWVLFEWVRGWIFTGFPWLLIGHAHHSSPLQGVLPLLGSLGASWVALLISCLLTVLVLGSTRHRLISAASLVPIAAALLLAGQVKWTTPQKELLSVAWSRRTSPRRSSGTVPRSAISWTSICNSAKRTRMPTSSSGRKLPSLPTMHR